MAKRIGIGVGMLLLLLGAGAFVVLHSWAGAGDDPASFESEIRAFEESDRAAPPAPGGIVFVGSSSIRFWSSLAEDMAPLRVVNRGFGGAHLSHVIHNAARVIVPYAPRAVVVYAGDNDIASGKSVETVVSDHGRLVDTLRASLPRAEIVFLSIKPSKRRWERWPDMARANAEIERISRSEARLHYVDVASVLLDEEGEPRDDVFVVDGLHLNETGYAAWTGVVAPALLGLSPEPAAPLR